MNAESPDRVGVVLIGRNEGERLRDCLRSVLEAARNVVYVDSGSTTNSVANARARGVAVVELDMKVPFTAARARNAGYSRLRELQPDLQYVQFIDGDCMLVAGWLDAAVQFLDEEPAFAVVWGGAASVTPSARSTTGYATSNGTRDLAKPRSAAAMHYAA